MKYFSPGLLDGSVTTAKLADNSVTLAKMTDFSIDKMELRNRAVTRESMDTLLVSLAGSIPLSSTVDITIEAIAWWPMLHTEANIRVTGHSVDGVGGDNARLGLRNVSLIAASTYDLDYRHLVF